MSARVSQWTHVHEPCLAVRLVVDVTYMVAPTLKTYGQVFGNCGLNTVPSVVEVELILFLSTHPFESGDCGCDATPKSPLARTNVVP